MLWSSAGMINLALMPISLIYLTIGMIRRFFANPKKVSVPVICVGSRYVGGAGKTPVVLALYEALKDNYNIAFISRGYGGNLSCNTPVKVTSSHGAAEVGDEPLLLAAKGPCYICRNRHLAAKMAISDGANLLILDDGLQNYTLAYDIKIAVENSQVPSNGLPFPAGPLREMQLNADIILDYAHDLTVHCTYQPKNQRVLAFCGIANPNKFAKTLLQLNLQVVDLVEFPDHHPYEEHEIIHLIERANREGLQLVTTEKDMVKIPHKYHSSIDAVPIEISIDNLKLAEILRLLPPQSKE